MNSTSTRPRWATRLVGAVGTVAIGSGLVLVTAGTASAAETTGGDLSWGVRESFRSYIAGPIAHGSVETGDGATTATDGTYTFPAATGTIDGDSVRAAFGGYVNFTGHAGLLDTTFSDLKIEIDGATGQLFVDADSKSMATGESVHYEDIPYVDLDLSGVTPTTDGASTTWSAIPATMTAEGQPVLGNYAAGAAMDPVTFTLDVAASEEPPAEEPPAEEPEAPETPAEPEAPADDEQLLSVTVPETTEEPEPGTFGWEISGDDSAVSLGTAAVDGDHLAASGEIKPVVITDTRTTANAWSITAQVSDFSTGAATVGGKYLGWVPKVVAAGDGAIAGEAVPSGFLSGNGLATTSVLGSAVTGHEAGTTTLGADLDLKLPLTTEAGTYSATLTLTALS